MENKGVPWQIIVISIIDFILALLSPFINILLILSIMSKFNLTDSSFIITVIPLPLILKIILPVLFIATGILLWKGKNIGRKLQIITLILLSIISIFVVDSTDSQSLKYYFQVSVPTILISLIIISYLLFNKKVKEFFR